MDDFLRRVAEMVSELSSVTPPAYHSAVLVVPDDIVCCQHWEIGLPDCSRNLLIEFRGRILQTSILFLASECLNYCLNLDWTVMFLQILKECPSLAVCR
ncbi:hypothetical protein DMJ13_19655 [halophilic archaeon]|nr:hypothetical protein DMJ13_19655 [halophilic archaeon]